MKTNNVSQRIVMKFPVLKKERTIKLENLSSKKLLKRINKNLLMRVTPHKSSSPLARNLLISYEMNEDNEEVHSRLSRSAIRNVPSNSVIKISQNFFSKMRGEVLSPTPYRRKVFDFSRKKLKQII